MTGNALHKSLPALAFALAAAFPVGSHAVDVRPLLKLGIDFGGETLGTVTFTDGSTQSIKSNQGFYLGGGALIRVTDSKDIEVEVSLSYKEDSINASNGNVKFTRMPVDALVFYRFPQQFRVGGGLTYHLNPKESCSGFAGCSNKGIRQRARLGAAGGLPFAAKDAKDDYRRTFHDA